MGKATWARKNDGVIARYYGRERLWTVERFKLKTDEDKDSIACESEKACQKPAGNNRRLKRERVIMLMEGPFLELQPRVRANPSATC